MTERRKASQRDRREIIFDQVRARARQQPQAIAILAPGRSPLTYRRLVEQVEAVSARLGAAGVQPGDRVAVVLPNGPEMAAAFLAVSATAACAPLNPAYTAPEFEFYLSDLKARLLIVEAGSHSPSSAAAGALGIPVIGLVSQGKDAAGIFSLAGEIPPVESRGSAAAEVALVLHTSGTTSRPKIVPLTHANLAASAGNIAAGLGLSPRDRCLNVMPLFHVHGLIGALLSSLAVGASVICAPGLEPASVLAWMAELEPSWYTAVPTMHQAILEAAGRQPELAGKLRLRFIRSCSSALAPQIGEKLEAAFRAPVIEAYGMTEAAHQIASNPLPPGAHKFGSVGLPVGDEVAILDEAGRLLSPGEAGEISIRGANVMHGYENDPPANARAFTDGWLRTGDCGYRDGQGYIFIQGRLKELINRGGEKIGPAEIDAVLLQHPAVLQAVAFALPHPTLGEVVAAAVVLRPGVAASPEEIRRFAAGRLSEFKVPRRVVLVGEIPKGPTGKIQRIGLAEKLKGELEKNEGGPAQFAPPRTPTEEALARVWQEVLGIPRIGIHDDFLAAGGDSLRAAQMLSGIRSSTGVELTLADLFDVSTIAGLAERIDRGKK